MVIIIFIGNPTGKGHVSQIYTREGKTTIISFVQALRVLQGFKGHIITSNPILAAEGVRDKT
jgi:preprotein translocase subunit SecA